MPWRTVATSEFVVPRSVRVLFGGLDNNRRFDVASNLGEEPQLTHRVARRAPRFGVEAIAQRGFEDRRIRAHLFQQCIQARGIAAGMRLGHRLAPLQFPLQKFPRQRRVALGESVDAAQGQKILGAADGIFQRAIRFVDARGGLKRQATFDLIAGRVAIGMDLALQRAVGEIELIRIEAIARRQAEQREVVLREIDHSERAWHMQLWS